MVSYSAAEELAQLDNWAGNVRAAESVSHIGELAGLHLLLGSIEAAGLDGVTLVPLALPSGIRSLPATDTRSGSTLRDRLGLTRPVNRYALEGKSL